MSEVSVWGVPVVESDGLWKITVRCVTDVRVGDQFIEATPIVAATADTAVSRVRGLPIAVNLAVRRLVSWERDWDVVSSGMAVAMYVSGDASLVPHDSLLVGPDSPPSKGAR